MANSSVPDCLVVQLEGGHVVSLTGSSCGLAILHPDIGKLTALRSIDLTNNSLTALPDSIGSLALLENLTVAANKLAQLPSSIGGLANLRLLRAQQNELTALPAQLGQLALLNRLNVGYNALAELPAELGDCAKLEYLLASGNMLTALPGTLRKLTNLRYIYFDDNMLAELPADMLGGMGQLLELRLQFNRLSSLPESLVACTQLRYLLVRSNLLAALPAAVGKLANLTDLHLSNNLLTSLPDLFAGLAQLDDLLLYDNLLTALPPSVVRLPALTRLAVWDNQLGALPPLDGLPSVTDADVSHNHLRALPALPPRLASLAVDHNELTDLPELPAALRTLVVSSNALARVPTAALRVAGLRQLDLSDNLLAELPPEVGALLNLTYLDVSANRLAALPAALGGLAALQTLQAHRNAIRAFPEACGGLVALRALDLDDNPLTDLPPCVAALRSLRTLGLNTARLTAVPAAVRGLANLTILDLRGNALAALPAWLGELALQVLLVGYNQLTALPLMPPTLRVLEATNNSLAALPPLAGTALVALAVPHNRLAALDLAALPPTLAGLSVARNAITALGPCLPTMAVPPRAAWVGGGWSYGTFAATTLDVSYNPGLRELPPLCPGANGSALEVLAASGCGLRAVPAGLTGLRRVQLASNALTALPDDMLAALDARPAELLDLRFNALATLPPKYVRSTITTDNDAHPPARSGLCAAEVLLLGGNAWPCPPPCHWALPLEEACRYVHDGSWYDYHRAAGTMSEITRNQLLSPPADAYCRAHVHEGAVLRAGVATDVGWVELHAEYAGAPLSGALRRLEVVVEAPAGVLIEAQATFEGTPSAGAAPLPGTCRHDDGEAHGRGGADGDGVHGRGGPAGPANHTCFWQLPDSLVEYWAGPPRVAGDTVLVNLLPVHISALATNPAPSGRSVRVWYRAYLVDNTYVQAVPCELALPPVAASAAAAECESSAAGPVVLGAVLGALLGAAVTAAATCACVRRRHSLAAPGDLGLGFVAGEMAGYGRVAPDSPTAGRRRAARPPACAAVPRLGEFACGSWCVPPSPRCAQCLAGAVARGRPVWARVHAGLLSALPCVAVLCRAWPTRSVCCTARSGSDQNAAVLIAPLLSSLSDCADCASILTLASITIRVLLVVRS